MPANSQSDRHGDPVCILVADDLSGACDAGVWFARKGLLTRVVLGCAAATDADVIAVSTDSRHLTAQAAAEQVRIAAGGLPLPSAEVVFKKIDSTFRGHIAAECDALMKLSGAPFGVIVPAVPSQGRIVEDGILSVQDLSGNRRLDIQEVLAAQGLTASTISPRKADTAQDLADRMLQAAASASYVLCDAADEQHLAMAAEALLAVECRPLWIGAAGLARHAAQLLSRGSEHSALGGLTAATGPVVLCAGSNHEVTQAQLNRVQLAYGGAIMRADSSATGQICRTAKGGSPLVVMIDTRSMIDTCSTDSAMLRRLLEEIRNCSPAAIVMTGGDTAALVCRAAAAKELLLEDEVVPGVPTGRIGGGLLDGIRVATKSGGFGGLDCLVDCIRLLSSNASTGAR